MEKLYVQNLDCKVEVGSGADGTNLPVCLGGTAIIKCSRVHECLPPYILRLQAKGIDFHHLQMDQNTGLVLDVVTSPVVVHTADPVVSNRLVIAQFYGTDIIA